MKKFALAMTLFVVSISLLAQPTSPNYELLTEKAHQQLKDKKYDLAARLFSQAIQANFGRGHLDDRYAAAVAWAMAGQTDSAFYQLNKIVARGAFSDPERLAADLSFIVLHTDTRWIPLFDQVKKNKQQHEKLYSPTLIRQLDTIYLSDQADRQQMNALVQATQLAEAQQLWSRINRNDSVNLQKVSQILDTHGWVGPEVVGQQGNLTLFLVIQHAPLLIQQKYLPLMRQAVKAGKAYPGHLATLEDRVALGEKRRQMYGSQLRQDSIGVYVLPLDDPDGVDQRRASMGLEPMGTYVKRWGIVWDLVEYKKQLPTLDKQEGIKP